MKNIFAVRYFLLTAFSLVLCYDYDVHYFKQPVDHFGYSTKDTFLQRYLISQKYWNGSNSPIFFYTGNEGDITMFANNTGIMWEFAEEFGALVVFAEHRYYGTSLPYGSKSYQNYTYLGYLGSEQALADFALLIENLKFTMPGARHSPVIAFGGSYGGMLSAWMRMKYPHIIAGSLASSAPVLQFTNLTSCNVFNQIVTKDFQQPSVICAESIKKSWAALHQMGKTDEGLHWLTTNFHLCEPLKSETLEDLLEWLSDSWSYLAMVNYPYPTDFLLPLPANPIKVACESLKKLPKTDKILLQNIMKAVSVFQNYTGKVKCFNLSTAGGSSLGEQGWNFQACTEMVMPMCSDGINDMFEPSPWNLTEYSQHCKEQWGVTPEPFKTQLIYGGKNINASSNIIFSNGILDPWSGGGVLKSLSKSLVAIVIPEAAHHLDLRASNPADPPSVINARKIEKKIIKEWISK